MAFKKALPPQPVPDNPESILLDLPRRKIPGVLLHQGEVMRAYVADAVSEADVAMQLPTGSGKTLVGLLIGEWRRRKYRERVVYLCPTRQLVNQVYEQADEQYGLTIRPFTGRVVEYSASSKADYLNADNIAVTTYSSLFNTNPFFDSPQLIIVDDAHAAENYIAGLWTLKIERLKPDHAALHSAVASVLKRTLTPSNFARLTGDVDGLADASWADKLPTPELVELQEELSGILDSHVVNTDLSYPWRMLRDHLHACHLYVSSKDILIRPLIAPTWLHAPFANANQRLFMSATLGAGGDLERLTGRRRIKRLPVPKDWDRQGIGRRYFIFPGFGQSPDESKTLRSDLMRAAGRSLVLTPNDTAAAQLTAEVTAELGYQVFTADDIEASKKPFIRAERAVAVVANRYDGIDFPGDDCRLLFIDGLPRATNSQERFIMSRMGANVLYNERVQTRVLQAIGRCTRSLQDFSAVVVSGEELPEYLIDRSRRSYLHPELQAELEFGIEQSRDTSIDDIRENFGIFMANGREWEEANEQILSKRAAAVRQPFPAIGDLQSVVGHEITYQERLWQGDFEAALASAEAVLGGLTSPDLRGYRAMWHYLGGSAAWMGRQSANDAMASKARLHYTQAKEAATGIAWLVALSRFQSDAEQIPDDNTSVFTQLERVELLLAQLGNVHTRKYDRYERYILDGLSSTEKVQFEGAHEKLGELLGFDVGNVETDGAPDPWWIAGKICFVFEDHQGAQSKSDLDTTKARQAASHPNWMRTNVNLPEDTECVSVLVTPVSTAKEGAMPHLNEVALWPIDEFRQWATAALAVMRGLRTKFVEPGDLAWRAEAAEAFEQNGLDAKALLVKLKQATASKLLKGVS